jgi:hypothetical protein
VVKFQNSDINRGTAKELIRFQLPGDKQIFNHDPLMHFGCGLGSGWIWMHYNAQFSS